MSDDSRPFDPDDEEMNDRLLKQIRQFAIYWCHRDVEAAEVAVQEASLRFHRNEPWKRKEYSTYGGVVAWLTVVIKNIRNKGYRKQARRDVLIEQNKANPEEPPSEAATAEDRLFKESVVKALKNVPAFVGKKEIQLLIQYQFVEDWSHQEIAKALGKTPRQLTKFKRKVYDSIPPELLFQLFRRTRNKKS